MTKLEAWKSWCTTAGTDRLADEFTLENSSHGKAFGFAWDAAHEACAKVCDEQGKGRKALEHYAALTYSGAAHDCAAAIRARSQQ